MPDLSDKARSILTFAAYHALLSGDPVREVVLEDGAGHRADPDGVAELEKGGLAETDGRRARFTAAGEAVLAKMMEAIRGVRLTRGLEDVR